MSCHFGNEIRGYRIQSLSEIANSAVLEGSKQMTISKHKLKSGSM